jgi:hypothetical protein
MNARHVPLKHLIPKLHGFLLSWMNLHFALVHPPANLQGTGIVPFNGLPGKGRAEPFFDACDSKDLPDAIPAGPES